MSGRSDVAVVQGLRSASAVLLNEDSLGEPATRKQLGQFFTPDAVSDFMASLLETRPDEVDLLDAGAGAGALTAAAVRHFYALPNPPKRIAVTAYELDTRVIASLRETLLQSGRLCEGRGISYSAAVHNEDFIAAAARMAGGGLFDAAPRRFNVAIVNPPYRKIRSDSPARGLLRGAGIETSNLYTGFVELITMLLAEGGELAAITPRSFCNGPYFRPFRERLLATMSLRRIHVFESRSSAFRSDAVLQENVIFHAVKGGPRPRRIIISSSSGTPGDPITERPVDFSQVVSPDDPERFIHLAIDDAHAKAKAAMGRLSSTLASLGLTASTGRVVDFRARAHLRQEPGHDTAPLIYPCHFAGLFVSWPREKSRKPQAVVSNERTIDLLVPAGVYVLVKRFTAKEERRRVVASIYDPERIPAPMVGFENHLDYFHLQGRGLPMPLAKGLAAFLNSTVVDVYFRQFSGHTQVNATDLRSLPYPSKAALETLGRRIDGSDLSQDQIDALVDEVLF
ncbi:MAG: Eco57I restriction-modification methylase domain-containing protein [Planctomycetota bacterium]|nr:Eco57I restriction-modification methylase domain-containing protein [Planctomycetota bacterium]